MHGVFKSRRSVKGVVSKKSVAPVKSVELLESRRLMSAAYPTVAEQYMLELINRARANPAGEAARNGISLNEGLVAGTISSTPKQPLAFNPNLTAAATSHSQWMLNTSTFSHNEGSANPGSQMSSAGYAFTGSWTWGQNIAWQGSYPSAPSLYPTVAQEEQSLFVDTSEPGRGHRLNMLNDSFREVGVGVVIGNFTSGGRTYSSVMTTQDFAASGSGAFLTGVAYRDSDHNNFYSPGEGIGSVAISAQRTSDNAVFSTTTWAAGGYTLKLSPGTYRVTASGSTYGTPSTYLVTIGSRNAEQNFNPGVTGTVTTPTPTPVPVTGGAASISGTFFYDSNANGVWNSGEPVSPSWLVYIDRNRNGAYDSGDTQIRADSSGHYSFTGLAAGTYAIRAATASGWTQTSPANGASQIVTVAAGQAVANINFGEFHGTLPTSSSTGSTAKGSISGSFFYDSNGNDVWDSTESTSPLWLIYIDANKDGKYDAGDTQIRADSAGHYAFTGLSAGTYVIRGATASGWQQTSPANGGAHVVTLAAGQNLTGVNFGERSVSS